MYFISSFIYAVECVTNFCNTNMVPENSISLYLQLKIYYSLHFSDDLLMKRA